jgi:hypothetical protein
MFSHIDDYGVSSGSNHLSGKPINLSIISTGGLQCPIDSITPCTRSITDFL